MGPCYSSFSVLQLRGHGRAAGARPSRLRGHPGQAAALHSGTAASEGECSGSRPDPDGCPQEEGGVASVHLAIPCAVVAAAVHLLCLEHWKQDSLCFKDKNNEMSKPAEPATPSPGAERRVAAPDHPLGDSPEGGPGRAGRALASPEGPRARALPRGSSGLITFLFPPRISAPGSLGCHLAPPPPPPCVPPELAGRLPSRRCPLGPRSETFTGPGGPRLSEASCSGRAGPTAGPWGTPRPYR